MAVWLKALALVPWDQVIANTPALIAGAKKLLKRTKESEPPPDALPDSAAGEAERLAFLEQHVREQQRDLHEMHASLEESVVLIQSLSDQNAQLVGAIDTLRQRVVQLTVAGAAVGTVLLGAVAYLLLR